MTDSYALAESLIAGLPDAGIVLDQQGRARAYNPSFVQLSGLRRRVLESRLRDGADPFTVLVVEDGLDRQAIRECLDEGRMVNLAEVTVTNAVEASLLCWLSFVPLRGGTGDVEGVLVVIRDVSSEARVQARFRDLLALTEARADDLERLVEKRTAELSEALEEVTRLSRIDPLTKLLNRRAFTEGAERMLALANRHGRSVAILMCDLDHFKDVNDTFGHRAGDAMLVACAHALLQAVRASDHVARFGGEEFIILLSETSAGAVIEVANRCRRLVEAVPVKEIVPGKVAPQTISLGISIMPDHGNTLDDLVLRADEALYLAKERGRNRVVVYDRAESERPPGLSGLAQRVRVLIADSDPRRRSAYSDLLAHTHNVLAVATLDEAISYCRRESFDVIVADSEFGVTSGVDFLGRTLRHRPGALRILMLDSKEFFVNLRGANLARVDSFVLRHDAKAHLPAAIDDGLARRRMLRDRLLGGGPFERNAYAYQGEVVREMLTESAFRMAYQPIVHCESRATMGLEALCRPTGEMGVGLEEIFDTAVREGSIWELGRRIRRRAIQILESTTNRDLALFINLHPAELSEPSFLRDEERLRAFAGQVVFEITERASINDFARLQSIIERLRGMGFRFAVDDLGAGYASLNSVAMLAPDFIKIDMEIVRHIDTSATKRRLVRRIVDFANDEGVQIIAEGVEDEGEAKAVMELGCHLMQGYLIGRPAFRD